ncbi:outer membrane beta-barrel protein [Vibrio fortis]|uniref:outer membrane beta-barrel protein n=1 Tax=Vibrio fortis TaxID=212667 RepID=UPI0036F22B89
MANTFKHTRRVSSGLILMALASQAHAAPFDFVIGAGYDFGGETMSTVQFTNGDSDKIESNEGLLIYGGVDVPVAESWRARATVGYKGTSVDGSNGEVTFERVPFELLGLYNIDNHNLGLGLTYHTGVEYKCDISNSCNYTVEFDDSLGFIAQYEYQFNVGTDNRLALGARYTHIDYTVKGVDYTVDSGGFGLNISFLF